MENLPQLRSDNRNGVDGITNESKIIQAHQQKKICKASTKELKDMLEVIAIMVGIQTMPDKAGEIVLLDAIRSVYPNLSLYEMYLAFEIALAGKLTIDENALEHYGVLSYKYVSGIFSSYARYAKTVQDELEKKYIPKELPPPPPQSDEDFIEENYLLWFKMKNKLYQFIDWNVYEKLIKNGLINLSEEDKIRIRAAVRLDLEQVSNKRRFDELQNRLKEIKDSPDGVFFQRQCKKYAVAEYFNKLIEQGKLKVL